MPFSYFVDSSEFLFFTVTHLISAMSLEPKCCAVQASVQHDDGMACERIAKFVKLMLAFEFNHSVKTL